MRKVAGTSLHIHILLVHTPKQLETAMQTSLFAMMVSVSSTGGSVMEPTTVTMALMRHKSIVVSKLHNFFVNFSGAARNCMSIYFSLLIAFIHANTF